MVKPSTCSVRISPPARGEAREPADGMPRARSSYAAARPVMPAPIDDDVQVSVRGQSFQHRPGTAELSLRLDVHVRASACTCSSGVVGSTPWPRLKMWPGRPAARAGRRRPPRAADRRARAAASDRDCPGSPRSWPIASHASSSGRRQSTPMTSPPASARSGEDRARCRRRSGSSGTPDAGERVEDAATCAACANSR